LNTDRTRTYAHEAYATNTPVGSVNAEIGKEGVTDILLGTRPLQVNQIIAQGIAHNLVVIHFKAQIDQLIKLRNERVVRVVETIVRISDHDKRKTLVNPPRRGQSIGRPTGTRPSHLNNAATHLDLDLVKTSGRPTYQIRKDASREGTISRFKCG